MRHALGSDFLFWAGMTLAEDQRIATPLATDPALVRGGAARTGAARTGAERTGAERTGAGGGDPARHPAGQHPGAELLGYPTGGHIRIGHDADLFLKIARFLHRRA